MVFDNHLANFVRGIGSVVANYDVDRHEDADKANQALKDAVAELMENEEIRGLVIGEPNFAGIVGLSNTAFTACFVHHAATQTVDGTLCPRQP